MSDFNERDKELLEKFGMTEEQVSSDVERMVTVTIKMPESQLEQVTAAAKRYHISRSEYIRRHLTNA